MQFGRDILFITSHRSNKFCGNIEVSLLKSLNFLHIMYVSLKGSPVVPPINPSSNVSSEDSGGGGKGVSVTPLGLESGNSKSFAIKDMQFHQNDVMGISIFIPRAPVIIEYYQFA